MMLVDMFQEILEVKYQASEVIKLFTILPKSKGQNWSNLLKSEGKGVVKILKCLP